MRPDPARLPPCPDRPNCVGSQETGRAHRVEPLAFTGAPEAALARLRTIVLGLPRTQVVDESPGSLHVTCRSALFRFVDDLQFVVDAGAGLIHVRSAARLGYSDLGVNRRRVERLRALWEATART